MKYALTTVEMLIQAVVIHEKRHPGQPKPREIVLHPEHLRALSKEMNLELRMMTIGAPGGPSFDGIPIRINDPCARAYLITANNEVEFL